ncbi:MAG TPA: hypothetical protein VGI48_17820 [Caldimonas sp.]|jgi:hypothetical protein
MHLLVPFAADDSEDCRNVLRDQALPNLERLLALLAAAGRDDGDSATLSPPHERALAAAWGWQGGDGLLPFAAHAAAADGIATTTLAWALLTPSHLQLGRDDVTLLDPALLALDEAESRALFASVAELFASEGFAIAWGNPERWYAARDDLQGLATPSLDRVIGRGVDRWLRASDHDGGGARREALALVRRLQSEAQLVFHVHEVNERREERGALVVNSIWLSGCGRSQPTDTAAGPEIASSLRAPLLVGDWAAWAEAWRALDTGAIARLLADARAGRATTLTLCGARSAARFELQPRSLWQRLRAPRGAAPDVLASL